MNPRSETFGIGSVLLLAMICGCDGTSQNGVPIAGAPDGEIEVLAVAESGDIEHKPGQFLEAVQRNDQKLVLVDFWAPWCGPCRSLSPRLDEIKKSWGDEIEMVKVDVDQNPEIAAHLGVTGIPDVRIFRNGTQVGGFVGARPQADIESVLKSLK